MKLVKIILAILVFLILTWTVYQIGNLNKSAEMLKFNMSANVLLYNSISRSEQTSAKNQLGMMITANVRTYDYLSKIPLINTKLKGPIFMNKLREAREIARQFESQIEWVPAKVNVVE